MSKKIKIFKITLLILVIAICVIATIYMFPFFKNISTPEGRATLEQQINALGYKGVFVVVGLMFAQMFLAILPGEPIELLAGICFGPIKGVLVIYLGVFITNLVIYFLIRKFGRRFIYSFANRKDIRKVEKMKLFSDPKTMEIILFLIFFIPGTPKDLFVYIGSLLPIKPVRFLLIATFARFPSIISSTLAGSNIIDGNWGFIAIIYGVTFLLSGIIFLVYNIRQNKNSKEDNLELSQQPENRSKKIDN